MLRTWPCSNAARTRSSTTPTRAASTREVVEGTPGDLAQHAPDDGLRLRPDLHVPCGHPRPGGGGQAVEAPQHRHRQDGLAVLVALVRPAEQVADAPDEAGEPGVGFGAQCGSSAVPPSASDCAGPGRLLSTGPPSPPPARAASGRRGREGGPRGRLGVRGGAYLGKKIDLTIKSQSCIWKCHVEHGHRSMACDARRKKRDARLVPVVRLARFVFRSGPDS